jgi:glycerol-3-phosphate dehydrogenase
MTRDQTIAALRSGQPLDLLVVGGGVTGAGIALESARAGARTGLVEASDFASGTSSRSSKLIHGGLRYLAHGNFRLTREAVRDRTELLRDASGLVKPVRFLLPVRQGDKYGRWFMGLALTFYDMFAGARTRCWHDRRSLLERVPGLSTAGLKGGWSYLEAETDDARLVLRVLAEARRHGALTLNYVTAEALLRSPKGVSGATLRDSICNETFEIEARCTVNATGVWADRLRVRPNGKPTLRPLRGSHLLFDDWRLPIAAAIGFFHPEDHRPIFAVPWQGAILIGTTDVDHRESLDREPAITRTEFEYLLTAVQAQFPSLKLGETDVISTWSGVRPIIASRDAIEPSKEKRDGLILGEDGLVTVTGGKLTTFRSTAFSVLRRAAAYAPRLRNARKDQPLFAPVSSAIQCATRGAAKRAERWLWLYGDDAAEMARSASEDELGEIRRTDVSWAEVRWACRSENVVHLDDLMLRRTRLGLLLRHGGLEVLSRVRAIAHDELKWSDGRWDEEVDAYRDLIARCYAIPRGPI